MSVKKNDKKSVTKKNGNGDQPKANTATLDKVLDAQQKVTPADVVNEAVGEVYTDSATRGVTLFHPIHEADFDSDKHSDSLGVTLVNVVVDGNNCTADVYEEEGELEKLRTLNNDEQALLEKCKATIERNKESFLEAAFALAVIHEKKLYLSKYTSFKKYCALELGISRSHGYRLLDAADYAKKVSSTGDTLPENLSQARKAIKKQRDEKGETTSKKASRSDSKTKEAVVSQDVSPQVVDQTNGVGETANAIESGETQESEPESEVLPVSHIIELVEEARYLTRANENRESIIDLLEEALEALHALKAA